MTIIIDRPRTTSSKPDVTPQPELAAAPPRSVVKVAQAVLDRLTDLLSAHSITALRISLGLVFLTFASFKYVAGASPAEDLAVATVGKLTFGIVTGEAALLMTAVMETIIGITLLTGRFLRFGLLVLAGALVGIMSPLVLFPDQMWSGEGPSLVGQYVFKDIVLAAGAAVVAAHALGARLRRTAD